MKNTFRHEYLSLSKIALRVRTKSFVLSSYESDLSRVQQQRLKSKEEQDTISRNMRKHYLDLEHIIEILQRLELQDIEGLITEPLVLCSPNATR